MFLFNLLKQYLYTFKDQQSSKSFFTRYRLIQVLSTFFLNAEVLSDSNTLNEIVAHSTYSSRSGEVRESLSTKCILSLGSILT